MVKKAGIAVEYSSHEIPLTTVIIKNPTIINAGAVAYPGTMVTIGIKKIDKRNSIPVVTEVNPVRPPSPTPEALSIYVVTELHPKAPPRNGGQGIDEQNLL